MVAITDRRGTETRRLAGREIGREPVTEMMKVYLKTVGCKLNRSEMDTLAADFARAGHVVVASECEADLCVVNTCTVTHVAEGKSRRLIRHLRRANPAARLVVTGCWAEMDGDGAAEIAGADLVVDNEGKERIAALVSRVWPDDIPSPPTPTPRPRPTRTRAFVKMQDGCDNHCTYCIVRLARGRQRSRPPAEVLAEIGALVAAGYNEVVLTGVHIGAYGGDDGQSPGEHSLWTLVADILAQTGVRRLRLSSIEPWDVAPEHLRLWDDPRLCRHLHLPLQSGCAATLRRMGRRYTPAEFAALVEAARRAIPDLAVTTDVMVGFPGETEAEFAESRRFVGEMGFSRLHVFRYSPRPGTPAASMPGQVPAGVKRSRAEEMIALGRRSGRAFRQGFVGRVVDVLWETRVGPGRWSGLTGNYLRVTASSEAELANTITATRITGLTADGLHGEVAKGI